MPEAQGLRGPQGILTVQLVVAPDLEEDRRRGPATAEPSVLVGQARESTRGLPGPLRPVVGDIEVRGQP